MYRQDNSASQTSSGSFVTKYRADGKLVWQVFKAKAEIWGLGVDSLSNVYITGAFWQACDFGCGLLSDSGKWAGFIAKMDSSGNCLWSKKIENAFLSRMVVTGNSIFTLGGSLSYSANVGCASFQNQAYKFVARFNFDGNCQWLQPIWTSGDICNLSVNDKYVAVCGIQHFVTPFGFDSAVHTGTPGKINQVYTALYNLNGNIKWVKQTVQPRFDVEVNSIALDTENNVYVTGQVHHEALLAGQSHSIENSFDIFAVKYNESGDTLLTRLWPGKTSEEGRAIHVNQSGVYFSGRCNGELHFGDTIINPGIASFFIARMDQDLKHVHWVNTYSSSGGGHSEIFKIMSGYKNDIIACGDYTRDLTGEDVSLQYNNWYYKKPFVISLKELKPVLVSTDDQINEQADFIIYPNPTSGLLNLSSTKTLSGKTELRVTDILGQCIFSKACYSSGGLKQIDLSKHPKGIYFIEIRSEKGREVRKVILE